MLAAGLLFFSGAVGTFARHWTYDYTTPITADQIQPGTNYALQAGFSVTAGDYHFLSGSTFSHSSNLTLDNVYTFEALEGQKDKNNNQIYYLKSKFGYVAVPENGQFYTNQLERAWKVVVKAAVAGDREKSYEHTGRNKANTEDSVYTYTGLEAYLWEAKDSEDPNLYDFGALSFNPVANEEKAVVIVSATPKDAENPYSYYNFLLTYPDGQANQGKAARDTHYTRNAWYVYTTSELAAKEGLAAVVKELTNDVDLVEKFKNYRLGTGAGEYSKEKYDALIAMWTRIQQILNDEATATDEEMDQLAEGLVPAYEAFVTSGKGLEEGYYILTSWRAETSPDSYDDGAVYDGSAVISTDKSLLWTWNGGNRLRRPGKVTYDKSAPLDYNSAKFIWQVIVDPSNPGLFFFKNFETEKYIGYTDKRNTAIPMTEEPEASYNIVANPENPGFFSFYSPKLFKNAGAQYGGIHCAGDYENVVAWDWRSGGSSWHVRTITQEELDNLRANMEQPKRNEAMKKLVEKAETVFVDGKAYMAVDNDGKKIERATSGDVYEVDGLVTRDDQLACPMPDPDEGANIGTLLDGDVSTYFHSTWRGGEGAWKGGHYLQIKLDNPETDLFFKWVKRDGNNNNGSPRLITIWGSNDESHLALDKKDGEGEGATTDFNAWKTSWDSVTVATFKYPYEVTWKDGSKKANAAGTAYAKLSKAYKFLRIEVTRRVNDGDVPGGNKYYHGAEMRLYKGAYDKIGSLIESVPQNLIDKLQAAIEVAKNELKDEAATQASLEALQAAYDEFMKNYPDPARIREELAEAKAVIEKAEEGEDLGYYATGSKATYQTVVTEVENQLAEIIKVAQPTVAQIDEMLAKLNAGTEAFFNALRVPTSGIYILRSNTSNEALLKRGIYAANSSTKQNVKLAGRVKDTDSSAWGDESNFKNRLGAYWRVEKVEGGYTYQNLFTGLYLAPAEKTSRAITQSEKPYVWAIRFAKEPGCFNLVAQKDDVPKGYVYLNAEPGSSNVVLWNTASGRDNSAFQFEAADPTETLSDKGFVYDLQHKTNPQIITFPIDVEKAERFYTVIGQDAENNIQLAAVTENLAAGQAYVYIPEAENKDNFIIVYSVARDANSLKATHTALAPVNGLVPTFEELEVPELSGKFSPDHSKVLLSEKGEKVAPNTGYFGAMPETNVTGAATISANGKISSIGGIVWGGSKAGQSVYTLSGIRVKNVKTLPAGLYIVNGKKHFVK